MTQTAIKIGNSVGMVIPVEFRKKVGIKQGSKLDVQITPDNKLVVDKSGSKTKDASSKASNKEFGKWLNKFMKENGEVLDELADR